MKKAIIIGAGHGIGQAVALRFGKEGFHISLIARTENKLEVLAGALQAENITADYFMADVSDEAGLKIAITDCIQKNGFPDLVLFNASAIHVQDVLEESWKNIQSCFAISTGGAFQTAQFFLPAMLKSNTGKLFFTGGGTALQGAPMFVSLSIGKAGMRNLVQALVERAKNSQVHIAQLTVCGKVDVADAKYSPALIAEEYWKLYQQVPGNYQHEVVY
ncbi:MAG: SDR family NAD(P)-dependent oxidoreductase [Saprospiraceae bacterium]|nr:SDR family NAD(P)-dependent oxidoreductase [Saprospiraceae bacterium]